ncbi:hypothetical protein MRX96_002059 [Rhipicephalus microplus]
MNLPVAAYVPVPDDSIRRVVYKVYTDETDHDLQAQLMKKNPDIPIINARRLGSSKPWSSPSPDTSFLPRSASGVSL